MRSALGRTAISLKTPFLSFLWSCIYFPASTTNNFPKSPLSLKVEPFYVVLSLFDVQNSRKISADFHVDLNHPLVRQMTSGWSGGKDLHINGGDGPLGCHSLISGLPEGALQYPKQGVFSVTCPHPEIFLVARVEKVLQGGIAHCTEPYMKSSDSAKVQRFIEMDERCNVHKGPIEKANTWLSSFLRLRKKCLRMQRQPAADWDSTGCHSPGLQGRIKQYEFSVKYSNLPTN